MLTSENEQTEIMRRQSDYKPPRSLRHWLIGRPLQTADAPHQTIGKVIGLAVFASDALSSNAYATQEILGVLAVAGMLAFAYVFPISIAIVALLAIVTISYQQTIYAYPGGGGAYIVSRDNLGETPAQIAGSALLTDYILTVRCLYHLALRKSFLPIQAWIHSVFKLVLQELFSSCCSICAG